MSHVSDPRQGPPITQESVNLAETICSTSDNVLYVTYPQGLEENLADRRATAGIHCGQRDRVGNAGLGGLGFIKPAGEERVRVKRRVHGRKVATRPPPAHT